MITGDGTLHPRPRLTRAQWIDLNGTWQFAYDDADTGADERWQDDPGRFDREIIVPFPPESHLSGIGDTGFHPVLWYRRSFGATRTAGQRLILHFGAVDYRARVWVNGDLVATHEGGHTPFSADITASLRPDGEQIVVVRAEDQPTDVMQPRGKQDWQETPHVIWYNRTSGIWQAVWLEPVPDTYIADLQLTPDLATSTVKVEAAFNRGHRGFLELRLSMGAQTLAAQSVWVDGIALETIVAIPAAQNGVHRDDLYWTPDNPHLISVSATLRDADTRPVDSVESYFGLRSVGIANGRFLLNDRPVFVRSVLEQGYWPQSHLAAPSPEALKEEVELIRSLGFNAVRIHQKVEDPRFLYWADHLGLMVWGEMANAYQYNPLLVERQTREWLDAVRRDRSHPSIVTWVPINESWGVSDIAQRKDQKDFATSLYHLTKAIDPTRPVISNDGWEHTISDIWSIHDYTQFREQLDSRYGTADAIALTLKEMRPTRKRLLLNPADQRGQPVMLTEFGGLSRHPKSGEAWFGYATAESDEEYLAMMAQLFDAIHESTDLAGFCYTQLTDTLQETNGLCDEHRQPKLPIERLRDIIWRPSRAVPSEALDLARQKALRIGFGQVV
ncbi:MAG: glycoside hydrolase family 2 [Devosia nanyangense]|uniref:Glycoside hydrolase family 2 n=1 Tax=Devosia nanyangense TaxID=1228055 RepID=A0A933L218_9HYPH|nr:glycoside hydrolase family 2 [Devosia nanyangense]